MYVTFTVKQESSPVIVITIPGGLGAMTVENVERMGEEIHSIPAVDTTQIVGNNTIKVYPTRDFYLEPVVWSP